MMDFSFEDLKQALLKEKSSSELVELPPDFYSLAAKHVAGLKRELELSEGVKRELLQAELKRVLEVIRELHLLRVMKALREVAKGRSPKHLLERERMAFEKVMHALKKLREELVGKTLEEEGRLLAPREITSVMLVITEDLPEILGDDLRCYGPFKRGDLAFLPSRSAELLVKQGAARKVEG